MRVRYVIGRAAMPKAPRRLKSGKLSTAKEQDTMAWMYQAAAVEEGQQADQNMLEHLQLRDQAAWAYRLDIWSSLERRNAALVDATKTTKQMRNAGPMPPRNPWGCDRCDWRRICEEDPTGYHILDNYSVIAGRPATRIGIKYNPRVTHWLNRSRAGRVVSPSELYSWNHCQRRWHFEYNQRLQVEKEWRFYEARARGSIVHAVAEELLLDWQTFKPLLQRPSWLVGAEMPSKIEQLKFEMMPRIASTLQRIEDEAGSSFEPSAIAEAMPGYFRTGWDLVALAMEGIESVEEVEQRRLIKLEGTNRWLTGKPDAVLRDKNGALVVLELKTSASTGLERAAERYRTNPAVDLYAAMIQEGQPAQS